MGEKPLNKNNDISNPPPLLPARAFFLEIERGPSQFLRKKPWERGWESLLSGVTPRNKHNARLVRPDQRSPKQKIQQVACESNGSLNYMYDLA